MGRIEEALRRAAAERDDPEPLGNYRFQEEADALFSSPWQPERPDPSRLPRPKPRDVHDLREASDIKALPEPKPAPGLRREPIGAMGVSSSSSSIGLESQLAQSWPQPFASEVGDKLVVMRGTDPAAVQQYRHLAQGLERLKAERGITVVMIASAVRAEGKTLTATNLALVLGQIGRQRVLLIDAALRGPKLHHLFQVSVGAGLNHALRLAEGQKLPLVQLTSGLTLLPAGRSEADQSALLGSDRMREILKDASDAFDWVVIDSGSLASEPEVKSLAAFADAIVLVVAAGQTPFALVEQAVDTLGRDRVVGVVLNRASDAIAASSMHDSLALSGS